MGNIHTRPAHNNLVLVDNLTGTDKIKSQTVEFVFRLVDRGKFFPTGTDISEVAYNDNAWRVAVDPQDPNRAAVPHLSAPSIYAQILEHFDLKPGQSFLNLGSGTGYFNTIIGFILGSCGVNHGVELSEYMVNFANTRKSDFMIHDPAVRCFDWCMPEYFRGNAFQTEVGSRYDRIYCGAHVPTGKRMKFAKMLKVNGILIMPYDNKLQRIVRMSEKTFLCFELASVSFSGFVEVDERNPHSICPLKLTPFTSPPTLFTLARREVLKNARAITGQKIKLHFRQTTKPRDHMHYPYDASEDDMLNNDVLNNVDIENQNHALLPERDELGYAIHHVLANRRANFHLEVGFEEEDDPMIRQVMRVYHNQRRQDALQFDGHIHHRDGGGVGGSDDEDDDVVDDDDGNMSDGEDSDGGGGPAPGPGGGGAIGIGRGRGGGRPAQLEEEFLRLRELSRRLHHGMDNDDDGRDGERDRDDRMSTDGEAADNESDFDDQDDDRSVRVGEDRLSLPGDMDSDDSDIILEREIPVVDFDAEADADIRRERERINNYRRPVAPRARRNATWRDNLHQNHGNQIRQIMPMAYDIHLFNDEHEAVMNMLQEQFLGPNADIGLNVVLHDVEPYHHVDERPDRRRRIEVRRRSPTLRYRPQVAENSNHDTTAPWSSASTSTATNGPTSSSAASSSSASASSHGQPGPSSSRATQAGPSSSSVSYTSSSTNRQSSSVASSSTAESSSSTISTPSMASAATQTSDISPPRSVSAESESSQPGPSNRKRRRPDSSTSSSFDSATTATETSNYSPGQSNSIPPRQARNENEHRNHLTDYSQLRIRTDTLNEADMTSDSYAADSFEGPSIFRFPYVRIIHAGESPRRRGYHHLPQNHVVKRLAKLDRQLLARMVVFARAFSRHIESLPLPPLIIRKLNV